MLDSPCHLDRILARRNRQPRRFLKSLSIHRKLMQFRWIRIKKRGGCSRRRLSVKLNSGMYGLDTQHAKMILCSRVSRWPSTLMSRWPSSASLVAARARLSTWWCGFMIRILVTFIWMVTIFSSTTFTTWGRPYHLSCRSRAFLTTLLRRMFYMESSRRGIRRLYTPPPPPTATSSLSKDWFKVMRSKVRPHNWFKLWIWTRNSSLGPWERRSTKRIIRF